MKQFSSSSFPPPSTEPSLPSHHSFRRLHHRTSSLSSSTSPSSTPDVAFSPASSPYHHYSSVPFSWECRPGIPKTPTITAGELSGDRRPLLPLPPLHRSALPPSRKNRSGTGAGVDPFSVALAECAKGCSGGAKLASRRGRSPAAIAVGRLAVFDLQGSCKTACSVVNATVRVGRSGSLGVIGRRSGS